MIPRGSRSPVLRRLLQLPGKHVFTTNNGFEGLPPAIDAYDLPFQFGLLCYLLYLYPVTHNNGSGPDESVAAHRIWYVSPADSTLCLWIIFADSITRHREILCLSAFCDHGLASGFTHYRFLITVVPHPFCLSIIQLSVMFQRIFFAIRSSVLLCPLFMTTFDFSTENPKVLLCGDI